MLGTRSARDRVTMARSAAALLVAAGLLALAASWLPNWDGVRDTSIRVVGAIALLVGLAVLRIGRDLSPLGLRTLPYVAVSLVSSGVYFGGGRSTSSAFALLYVWAVLWTTYFLPRRDVAGVTIAAVASHAVVV